MTQYFKKRRAVDAMQWSGTNAAEIFKAYGMRGDDSMMRSYGMQAGDWLIRETINKQEHLYAVAQGNFAAEYTELSINGQQAKSVEVLPKLVGGRKKK